MLNGIHLISRGMQLAGGRSHTDSTSHLTASFASNHQLAATLLRRRLWASSHPQRLHCLMLLLLPFFLLLLLPLFLLLLLPLSLLLLLLPQATWFPRPGRLIIRPVCRKRSRGINDTLPLTLLPPLPTALPPLTGPPLTPPH